MNFGGNELNLETKACVNQTAEQLIQAALENHEGKLAANGALTVLTGPRTGRSPKDRFIVKDAVTEFTVDWGVTNQAISQHSFDHLWQAGLEYLQALATCYIGDYQVGANPQYAVGVKVMTELAWHQLFVQNLFIKHDGPLKKFLQNWTILNVPGFLAQGQKHGVNSEAAILLNFSQKRIFICGTQYAGEMKKAMFTVLNFLLPEIEILPMHCAANADQAGNTALFFGLSGTGKTTLSADPERFLIGDDEHGWGKDTVFNFEGGCYAKCIDLSAEKEPLIWNAIRQGTVLENVVMDKNTLSIDYHDTSITQNTRAAYPRSYIEQRVETNMGREPSAVIFLTCDLYGVLPPVAKLTLHQAAYYFLSGYTALVGSTEMGSGAEIKPTFSTCFGAPFFPRPARAYAELLIKRLNAHPTSVYLVNTGWTGGAHGHGGKRFAIPVTRKIITAIVSGELEATDYNILPGFNLAIPSTVNDVDAHLLDPREAWQHNPQYKIYANQLIDQFIANFQRFDTDEAIKLAGPQHLN